MGRILVSSVVVCVALVLAGCEADQPLKAKQDEADVAISAVSDVAPSAADGWTLRDSWSIETAHPYAPRVTKVWTITEPGASSIRIHFGGFKLENGYDWVTLSTPDGGSKITYTGTLGDFWSAAVPGPTARIELDTDASVNRYGFKVLGYAARPDGEQWSTTPFVWETAHPYANDQEQKVEISQPGAVKMKVLFGDLDLEDGYDFVRVYDAVGRQVAEYTGTQQKFETPAFPGDHLTVVFSSDESVTKNGVSIAQYSFVSAAGEPGCTPTSTYVPVCGENGKTYVNAAAAACESVTVAHQGACGVAGDFCGGIAGVGCASGFACHYDGSYADAGGSCQAQ